jgi:hypothetical protein
VRAFFLLGTLYLAGFSGLLMIFRVKINTSLQLIAAPNMRASILAYYGVISRAGPALGALWVGALSDFIGLRWATTAAVTLSFAACTILFATKRHVDSVSASP